MYLQIFLYQPVSYVDDKAIRKLKYLKWESLFLKFLFVSEAKIWNIIISVSIGMHFAWVHPYCRSINNSEVPYSKGPRTRTKWLRRLSGLKTVKLTMQNMTRFSSYVSVGRTHIYVPICLLLVSNSISDQVNCQPLEFKENTMQHCSLNAGMHIFSYRTATRGCTSLLQ